MAPVGILGVTRTGPGSPQRRDHPPRLSHINDVIASAMKTPARNMPDDLGAVWLTTAANGNDSGPFVGIARRQAPHPKTARRRARQINALPVYRILPDNLLQNGHDALAILRIGLPGTRLRLREENEHVERLLPLSDKRPRPIGRWFVAIHPARAVAMQIYQQRIGPISLVFRRNKERVLPLDLLRVSTFALSKASACLGQDKVSQKTNQEGETKQYKELISTARLLVDVVLASFCGESTCVHFLQKNQCATNECQDYCFNSFVQKALRQKPTTERRAVLLFLGIQKIYGQSVNP